MGSGAFLVEACRQLGEALVLSWHKHDEVPPLPPDENDLLLAMRMIAQRCLYGVDKNPLAADLAKLSLWLATLAKDHPVYIPRSRPAFRHLDILSEWCAPDLVGGCRLPSRIWHPADQQFPLVTRRPEEPVGERFVQKLKLESRHHSRRA